MSNAAIEIVRAGLHTTVQDEGRWGFQHLGVPVGGALDLDALRRANTLVGNAPDEAALEVTLTGCTLRVTADVHVAVTGARFLLTARAGAAGGAGHGGDVEPVPMDTAVLLRRDTTLVMGERQGGARAYVAVRGGFDVPATLGSRSAWPLLPRRGALQDGCVLALADRVASPVFVASLPTPRYRDVLRVLPGPEAARSPAALDVLCGDDGYRIAASASRMAYPLEDGPAVPLRVPHRSSSGTVTGALQILPTGVPVLLMAERQTTGGYPVAAVVIAADLPHAAQLPPGARVRFVRCTRGEALAALITPGARERA
jgi:biotin-dependent carboxylase-like uncharacterized protein